VYGTWIDAHEMKDILAHAALIRPHLPEGQRDAALWFGREVEPDDRALSGKVHHTAVVDDPGHYGGSACIFLRPDFKCALQVAGETAGKHPWRFKPFYCILHPMELDEQGRFTLDETHLMVDEPASCLRQAGTPVLLSDLFTEELRYFLPKNRKPNTEY